jgi:hypothetical protein
MGAGGEFVGVGFGLKLEKFATESGEVDVERAGGWRAVWKGGGKEVVVCLRY